MTTALSNDENGRWDELRSKVNFFSSALQAARSQAQHNGISVKPLRLEDYILEGDLHDLIAYDASSVIVVECKATKSGVTAIPLPEPQMSENEVATISLRTDGDVRALKRLIRFCWGKARDDLEEVISTLRRDIRQMRLEGEDEREVRRLVWFHTRRCFVHVGWRCVRRVLLAAAWIFGLAGLPGWIRRVIGSGA